jgi:hypothetical protein
VWGVWGGGCGGVGVWGGFPLAFEHSKVCTLCDFGHLQFLLFITDFYIFEESLTLFYAKMSFKNLKTFFLKTLAS